MIYNAADNRRLVQILNNLREQMYRYRMEYLKDERTHQVLSREHEAIRKALEAHDVEKAAAAMNIHIENQKNSILESLEENPGRKQESDR